MNAPRTVTTYEYRISSHFLCAIEYGDDSGLSNREVRELNAFLAHVVAEHGAGHWSHGEIDEFGHCEVTGKYGEVSNSGWVVLS